MANSDSGDRMFPSLHNVLKMILSANTTVKSTQEDKEIPEDVDEPPDHGLSHASPIHGYDGLVYIKSPTIAGDCKESLLTRALRTSPELSPPDQHPHEHAFTDRSYPQSNVSGISTAELTSDGGLTSPSIASTPSPPIPFQLTGRPGRIYFKEPSVRAPETTESKLEVNLGRKRCISFACARKADEHKQRPENTPANMDPSAIETPKRKTALTFACPTRQTEGRPDTLTVKTPLASRRRKSPAPITREPIPEPPKPSSRQNTPPATNPRGIPTSGLGEFKSSEATRFHEFASSADEDEDWVAKAAEYSEKITMSDCMKKEMAIRKLGEEAEEEALQDEEDAAEVEVEDVLDDDSTVHDFSDDGNESDNEAGFAESDDSDDGSEYEFWAPVPTTSAASPQMLSTFRQNRERRDSHTSLESAYDQHHEQFKWLPAPLQKNPGERRRSKMRPGTPDLPDSTDFVCGTLDEDRPLEAAYKSCLEQRRRSKQIIIPQDIDPSFPTTDPEDNADGDEFSTEDLEDVRRMQKQFAQYDEEALRGRQGRQSGTTSPHLSPKRMLSPAPRRQGRASPKRLKSPAPLPRPGPPSQELDPLLKDSSAMHTQGLNISGLVQRRPTTRTKSLPRTPNPFFTSLDKSHRWTGIIPVRESSEQEASRTLETHTRGPIDIVEGLEQKRQKRKEKYWRQHCRKAAKEHMERRPIPGKGAERMKELGLEVAERFRAYGVGQDTQLVLSV